MAAAAPATRPARGGTGGKRKPPPKKGHGGFGAPKPPALPGAKVTPLSWAKSFLSAIGAPETTANLSSVVAWEAAEGGNWNNTATFNPLNTTQPAAGSTPINSIGVQAYPTWSEGMTATVTTIQNGSYADVLSALQSGKGLFGQTFEGLSDWSGNGYDSLTPAPGYAGGAGATIGQGSQGPSANPATCLISWPSAHIDLFFGAGPTVGGGCLFSKSQGRAVMGAVFFLAGSLLLFGGGVLLVTATAVTAAGPWLSVLSVVPGGKAVAAAGKAAEKAEPEPAKEEKEEPSAEVPVEEPAGES